MSCPPRYATRRRPERETFGPELAVVAEKLGQPFMPWQHLVADVGGEIDPVTGLPAYREVRVTVPRQSGKTSLFLSWQINRCVSRRWRHPQRSAFTAQTGKDARDKWIDELFPLIRNSQLKSLVATTGSRLVINEGMGNESIRFKTGSLIRLLSTSTSSGHSKTLHQAVMDEVWHDTDDRREQGLRPAMITIPDAQLLVCSTAGTEASLILNRKVDTGRASVEADVGVGVAYFEWSAPKDWDPDDEESYYTFMPALCPRPPCRCAGRGEAWRHTITSLDAIRQERAEMEPMEFRRAYGNVATSVGTTFWKVISEADWLEATKDGQTSAAGRVAFALDLNPERSASSIAVAGSRADGDLHAEVVDHRPGTSWAVGRLVELCRRWKPCAVVVDPAGAAGSLIPDIEEGLKPLGIELTKLTGRQVAAAYGMFRDGVSSEPDAEDDPVHEPSIDSDPEPASGDVEPVVVRDVKVRPHPALTLAVAGAAKRRVGDGTSWDRRHQSVDISPLVAATNAVYGFVTAPEPPPNSSVPLVAWR
jgi:hypothetical protein